VRSNARFRGALGQVGSRHFKDFLAEVMRTATFSSHTHYRNSMNRRSSLAALLSLLTCTASAQGSAPTDADLRTAYCIAILQDDIARDEAVVSGFDRLPTPPDYLAKAFVEEIVAQWRLAAEKQRAQHSDTLKRLQLFLLPRIPHLDAAALRGAAVRAAADMEESTKQWNACVSRCVAAGKNSALCAPQCGHSDVRKRIDACYHPTWLTF
jgi:hypothetical protein